MVSRQFERLNNRTSAELVGRTADDVYPPETAAAIRAQVTAVLEAGEPITIEIDAPLEDGMHTYLAVKFPIRDDAGRIVRIGGWPRTSPT